VGPRGRSELSEECGHESSLPEANPSAPFFQTLYLFSQGLRERVIRYNILVGNSVEKRQVQRFKRELGNRIKTDPNGR
jgi:hypothetical protein